MLLVVAEEQGETVAAALNLIGRCVRGLLPPQQETGRQLQGVVCLGAAGVGSAVWRRYDARVLRASL